MIALSLDVPVGLYSSPSTACPHWWAVHWWAIKQFQHSCTLFALYLFFGFLRGGCAKQDYLIGELFDCDKRNSYRGYFMELNFKGERSHH